MVNLSFINLQHLECTEKNINATRKLVTLYERSIWHKNAVRFPSHYAAVEEQK